MNFWSNNAVRKWRSYLLVVVGAYVLTLAVGTLPAPLRADLENLVFDQYQRWFPRPYKFDQPVRIVDIDDESNSSHRSMAVVAPDDGGSRRQPGEGQCRRDRVRRLVFREGPADRHTRPARAASSTAPTRPCAARSALTAMWRLRTRLPIARRARRLSHPEHNGAQASLTTKAGFSFVGDPPMPFLDQLKGSACSDSRSCGRRERPRFSQLDAGRRPRRSSRAAPARRQRPDPAESGDGDAARRPRRVGLCREIHDRLSEARRARARASRRSRSATSWFRFRLTDNCACGSPSPTRAARSRPGKSSSQTPISPISPASSCLSARAPRCFRTLSRRRSIHRRRGSRRMRSSSSKSSPASLWSGRTGRREPSSWPAPRFPSR